jgi:hypothetical protein
MDAASMIMGMSIASVFWICVISWQRKRSDDTPSDED